MRLIIKAFPVSVMISVLVLISACGSDGSKQDISTIDEARAEALYQFVVTQQPVLYEKTGISTYQAEAIILLEEAIASNPHHHLVMHILSWIYSTYPAYIGDKSYRGLALDYGREVFNASGSDDVYMYEILGAALYKNGEFEEGDIIFDQAIKRAESDELVAYFRESKQRVRALYADVD